MHGEIILINCFQDIVLLFWFRQEWQLCVSARSFRHKRTNICLLFQQPKPTGETLGNNSQAELQQQKEHYDYTDISEWLDNFFSDHACTMFRIIAGNKLQPHPRYGRLTPVGKVSDTNMNLITSRIIF